MGRQLQLQQLQKYFAIAHGNRQPQNAFQYWLYVPHCGSRQKGWRVPGRWWSLRRPPAAPIANADAAPALPGPWLPVVRTIVPTADSKRTTTTRWSQPDTPAPSPPQIAMAARTTRGCACPLHGPAAATAPLLRPAAKPRHAPATAPRRENRGLPNVPDVSSICSRSFSRPRSDAFPAALFCAEISNPSSKTCNGNTPKRLRFFAAGNNRRPVESPRRVHGGIRISGHRDVRFHSDCHHARRQIRWPSLQARHRGGPDPQDRAAACPERCLPRVE